MAVQSEICVSPTLATSQLDTVFEVALDRSGESLEPEPGSGILGVYVEESRIGRVSHPHFFDGFGRSVELWRDRVGNSC